MHTKTHMWGRRCERGVRVLRACAHGASICVAVAPRRVSAMDTNVANLRVAFLTRPVGRGGAHGAFVSGPCSGTAHLLLHAAAAPICRLVPGVPGRHGQQPQCAKHLVQLTSKCSSAPRGVEPASSSAKMRLKCELPSEAGPDNTHHTLWPYAHQAHSPNSGLLSRRHGGSSVDGTWVRVRVRVRVRVDPNHAWVKGGEIGGCGGGYLEHPRQWRGVQ